MPRFALGQLLALHALVVQSVNQSLSSVHTRSVAPGDVCVAAGVALDDANKLVVDAALLVPDDTGVLAEVAAGLATFGVRGRPFDREGDLRIAAGHFQEVSGAGRAEILVDLVRLPRRATRWRFD